MTKPLSVLFVSSEVYPFAKTGGLADVSYSLPLALRDLGHDIRVMLPKYGSISERKNKIHEINRLKDIPIPVGETESLATVKSSSMSNPRTKVQAYVTTNSNYLDAYKGFYADPVTGIEYENNDERFIFFNKSVLQTCLLLGWFPDIIHCHDWQTGLIPALAREMYPEEFKNTKIIYTIHNFGNQGSFPAESIAKVGLHEGALESITHNGRLNFMKAGIVHANRITTVSPTYCGEVLAGSELSDGLDIVLKSSPEKMMGILHGVDMMTWNPAVDPIIAKKYTADTLTNKIPNKEALLKRSGLPMRLDIPLIGMIGRLNEQKGVQLILEAAERLFAEDIHFILLGDGEQEVKQKFAELAERYPQKVSVTLGFDDELAHMIEAGADMYLMPSLFEPCGLNQQYSLVYGTVPIVRSTGGLKDTVFEYNLETGEGNGFVFEEFSADAMLEAIHRALGLYAQRDAWLDMVQRGMREDHSWGNAARQYSEMYRSIMKDLE